MDPCKYATWNGEENFMERIILVLKFRAERNKLK
jgi:hypothetical protein